MCSFSLSFTCMYSNLFDKRKKAKELLVVKGMMSAGEIEMRTPGIRYKNASSARAGDESVKSHCSLSKDSQVYIT
jgi:hypothetical protein